MEGVTKITRIEVESLSDEQAATIRKMFVAMSKDIRVIVIKLADRLHNMRTLGALREDRRIFKARETLEIYAPIAHRLGINNIKWELEDLSFYYLEPNKYKQVSRMVTESRAEREGYLDQIIGILHDEMEKVGITGPDHGPPEAPLLHLPEDDAEGQGLLRDLRPHCRAHHRAVGEGLLLGPRRGAYAVAPDARPLQRLHRHAEVQHVPEPAHHGHRPGGTPARGADPHRGHAPPERVRRGRALALQGEGRQERRCHRPAAGVAPPDGGLAGRDAGLARVPERPESGSGAVRGVRVHAEGRGHEPARRLDAG